MITILVWLLISTSDGSHNNGNVTVVERFATAEDCTHVLNNIPNAWQQQARCVQAKILVEKK